MKHSISPISSPSSISNADPPKPITRFTLCKSRRTRSQSDVTDAPCLKYYTINTLFIHRWHTSKFVNLLQKCLLLNITLNIYKKRFLTLCLC